MKYYNFLTFILVFLFIGCGGSASHDNDDEIMPGLSTSSFSNDFVYDSNSSYKDVLKGCISINHVEQSCSLHKLPLLMQENQTVTKDMIRKRLLVSHKWMGDRFLEMIDMLDGDIKKLLGSVTAIVIDDDIKPSFYWNLTGAIYLDARYLWLNPSEANTIHKKDDYRTGYGKDLNFLTAWRYVKNGAYAYKTYSLDSGVTREKSDILYHLASLLYHELGHANDFVNSSTLPYINTNDSIYYAIEDIKNRRVSTKLYEQYALTSTELKDLAKVLYGGQTPTTYQKSLSPSDVGDLFDGAGATDLYGYYNQYEDLAMLFEESMMRYHFDIDRDVGFVSTDSDYVIGWGERGRIKDNDVKLRAKFVVKNLFPNEDAKWDSFFDNLGNSTDLQSGARWYDTATQNSNFSQRSLGSRKDIEDFKPINY